MCSNKNEDKCDEQLLIKNYDLLYKFNLVYLFGHITIFFDFLIINVYEMMFYNVLSVAWFAYNAYKMKKGSIYEYDIIEKRIMMEVILHQLLAFYFVGASCGFQYILLGYASTIFTLYKNSNGKKFYIFKAVVMICLFVALQLTGNYYTPKVHVDEGLATLWTILNAVYVFVTAAYFTLKSYTNITVSLDTFKSELTQKNKKIQNLQRQMIIGLANVIESRDEDTGGHVYRTSNFINSMLKEMKSYPQYSSLLTEEFITNMKFAAPMHDVGKIKIPDAILLKPEKLTEKEFEEMKKHTVYGGEIINKTLKSIDDEEYLKMAYNVTVHHHEKWDGTGYPYGLKGDQIPIEARIMAFVDVFDALTSERPYKRAFTPEEAYNLIKKDLGKHFDPLMGEIFLDILKKEYEIKDDKK